MHNGELADRKNPFTIEIKKLNAKRGKDKTETEHDQLERLEWEGALYWHEDAGLYIPNDNIERCLQLGAQKSRLGKNVQAAVWVADDIVALDYAGPSTKDELYKDKRFQLRKSVIINKARIVKVRPMVPTGWKLKFSLEYDDTVIADAESLFKCIVDAGALIGLGDWRPKFGRFTVEILK